MKPSFVDEFLCAKKILVVTSSQICLNALVALRWGNISQYISSASSKDNNSCYLMHFYDETGVWQSIAAVEDVVSQTDNKAKIIVYNCKPLGKST